MQRPSFRRGPHDEATRGVFIMWILFYDLAPGNGLLDLTVFYGPFNHPFHRMFRIAVIAGADIILNIFNRHLVR